MVLVVLIAIYFYAKAIPEKTEVTKEASAVEVLRLDKEKIKKIDIDSSASKVSLVKEGTEWKAVGENRSLDQNIVNNLVNSLSVIIADRLISEKADDLAQYGLKEPANSVTVILDGGEQKVILLGDKTLGGDSVYIKIKDDVKVFTVDATSVENYDATLEEIVAKADKELDTSAGTQE
jgi:hypothetical protein